jgi:bidirectional [NiFe] hydrogenase diaphorase subunit
MEAEKEKVAESKDSTQSAVDSRFKVLDATMKRNQNQPDALIEVLHNAQELFGFLKDDVLIYITQKLKLPLSQVYGVATFYNFFSLTPKGEHTCVVCMGTACYVKGANQLVKSVEEYAHIKSGDTTEDKKYTLLVARCVGACGIAPAIVFDGNMAGYQTPETVIDHIKGWYNNGSV